MKKTRHDWRRADAMTDEEIHAAALSDPDAQPLTPQRLATMRRTPQVRVIRRALGLSQEEFAARSTFRSERCGTGSRAAKSLIRPRRVPWRNRTESQSGD
jgi:hypothetical protein